MEVYYADMHIHSCLSPCAELDMTPLRIIRTARELDIRMIAIADHNSAENLAVSWRLAERHGVTLVPAMEMTTREETHVLGLFGTVDAALAMQEVVYAHLADAPKRESDYQVVVNELDEVMGMCPRGLMGASTLSLSAMIDEVHRAGGLAVPCHIDRQSFSLTSQFGLIPSGLKADAFEAIRKDEARVLLFEYGDRPVICSSDAHRPDDIGRRRTELYMEAPTFEELRLAFRGEGGRRAGCA